MHCIALAAITLDGKIARHEGHFSDWTSPEDKNFLHEMLAASNVVVVGNNTYKTAKEPLSRRNCIVLTRSVTTSERVTEGLFFINPEKSDLRAALEPYETVAVLGGAQTYTYCLENGFLDDLYITIEPIIFGNGIDLFAETKASYQNLVLISMKELNTKGTVLLHYRVPHPTRI